MLADQGPGLRQNPPPACASCAVPAESFRGFRKDTIQSFCRFNCKLCIYIIPSAHIETPLLSEVLHFYHINSIKYLEYRLILSL